MESQNLGKIGLIYSTFKYAALSQLKNEDTFVVGVGVGLYQGLKYNGNLVRGVKNGVATMLVLSAATGVLNVMQNWDKIKNLKD